jgi:hypothetical protein
MVNKQRSTSPEMMKIQSWKQVMANSFIISPGADGYIREQVVKALADLSLPKPSRDQVEASIIRAVLDFSANLTIENVSSPSGEVHLRIFNAQPDNRVETSAQSSLCWGFFLVQNSTSQPGSQKLSLDIYLYQE